MLFRSEEEDDQLDEDEDDGSMSLDDYVEDEDMDADEHHGSDYVYHGTPAPSSVAPSRPPSPPFYPIPGFAFNNERDLRALPQIQVLHAVMHDVLNPNAEHELAVHANVPRMFREPAEQLVARLTAQSLLQLPPRANIIPNGPGPLFTPSPVGIALGQPLSHEHGVLLAMAAHINVRAALLEVFRQIQHMVDTAFRDEYLAFLRNRNLGADATLADYETLLPYAEDHGTPFLFACEQWALRRYHHFFSTQRDHAPNHHQLHFASVLHDTALAIRQGEDRPDADAIRQLRRARQLGHPWAVRPVVCEDDV